MDRAPVVNIDATVNDPAFGDENRHGARFAARLAAVGRALGTSQIGVDADRHAARPRHFHHVNEALFLILSGEATLRYGDATQTLRPGHMAGMAPGAGIPFQLINEGATELRYLALSGLAATDAFEHPDSGEIGLVTGGGPMRGPQSRKGDIALHVLQQFRLIRASGSILRRRWKSRHSPQVREFCEVWDTPAGA